jgi:hypothetical protein
MKPAPPVIKTHATMYGGAQPVSCEKPAFNVGAVGKVPGGRRAGAKCDTGGAEAAAMPFGPFFVLH